MSKAARQLLSEFESLPEEDQRTVAAEILRRAVELDSLSPEDIEVSGIFNELEDLTDEQREEIDRRLADHARNPDSAIPWEEGRTRLHRRFV